MKRFCAGFCWVGLVLLGVAHAAEAQPDPRATDAPANAVGKSVAHLIATDQLEAQRHASIAPMLARRSALHSALAILALPTPNPSVARQLREETDRHRQEIARLEHVLAGSRAAPDDPTTRSAIGDRVRTLRNTCNQKQLLASAYEAQGNDRLKLLEQVRAQEQALSQEMQAITAHYKQRSAWLEERTKQFNDSFQRAMHRYARIAELGTVSVQASRVYATINQGRLTFSWTDRTGANVASAMLKIRPRPDAYDHPPYVLERYPVLLQGQQEAQISAGYFLIEFRVAMEELAGEQEVLEAATKLLDIDGLGRLVPRLGSNGLD